jgi:hypothetical protein
MTKAMPVAHQGPRRIAPITLTKCCDGLIFAMPMGILTNGETATPMATNIMARATLRVSISILLELLGCLFKVNIAIDKWTWVNRSSRLCKAVYLTF